MYSEPQSATTLKLVPHNVRFPLLLTKKKWNHRAILRDPGLRIPGVLEWDVLGLGLLWCTGLGSGGYEGSAAPMGHVPRAITEHSR